MPKITNDTAYPLVVSPATSDEIMGMQSDEVKKFTIAQIISFAETSAEKTVTYNNSDVTINLAVGDLNGVLIVDNASNVQINLPSVAAENIGIWLEVHKVSSGNVVIKAADSDTISNSSAGGTISNTESAEVWASISILLATSTKWQMTGAPLGTWVTA